jgi:TetR/AcrR family transcriptional regulator, transcriptional repressor for nem operon
MARTGRPRSFDEQEVVARARDLFWSRGYGATSVRDLVDGLGVERGSLYGAFGDKRQLFLQAVALYIRENQERLEAVLAAGPVLPTLRRVLTEPASLTSGSGNDRHRGCLVGNTTAELVPGDDDAKALVAAAYAGFVQVVSEALRRGQASGEVITTATPEAQALLLQMLFQGSTLISRAGIDREQLNQSIDVLIDSLRQPETSESLPK